MNAKDIKFSKTTEIGFTDYMNQYLTENYGYKGLCYNKEKPFDLKERKMNEALLQEAKTVAGLNFSIDPDISMEMWATNPQLKWAAMAVANKFIDSIAYRIIDKSIGVYAGTYNVAMGESPKIDVAANDYFVVSKAGRNQRTVDFQRTYDSSVTVIPENREITVAVNFYRVLCGMDSLARFVAKAVMSIEAQISREIYTGFDTAMSLLPLGADTSNLRVAGYTKKDTIKLAQKVSAYNNNAPAMIVGTKLALSDILPDNANYRYDLESDYVKLGYVKNAFGFDTMELPQIAKTNGSYDLSLKDDRFYVISPTAGKLIYLVYEGSSITNNMPANQSADLTETTTINKSWGILVATNATAGIVTLA